MDVPKAKISKNTQWPEIWSACLDLGGLRVTGWGCSPEAAYRRLITSPSAYNGEGGRIESRSFEHGA